MRLEYRIKGMDCAEEVAALKQALHDVPDIVAGTLANTDEFDHS